MLNVLSDTEADHDEIDRRSDKEWLQTLRDYQATLKMQLRSGCSKEEYDQVEKLEEAVDLVIKKLQKRVE